MTRKKVKLAFITNDSARKATYKKRKRGLLKKMEELTTLCDVKACAVLYSPYESKPVVWPNPSGARDVISSFKRLPEMEKVKKMVSQEEFLRQRVVKAHEQLKRQQKENREKEMTQVMYQCLSGKTIQNMNLLDLSDLGWVINQHIIEINKRIEGLRKENYNNNNFSNDNTTLSNASNNTNTDTDNIVLVQQSICSAELQGQKGDFDAVQMQMMMQQPWSSFMDMMGAPMVNDHHHHQHIEVNVGENSGVTNNSNNNMNMLMMMGQFGDYQGQGQGQGHVHGQCVNPTMWSNHFFP
ncbi:hypothetical protein RND81_10G176600 [Saponaria officinalis]|uniref:MADS-box domain-containing protein n=1 Tax=Saponaria officinalis TaxID=3572 RepID=A0AAW1I375_SAPOF